MGYFVLLVVIALMGMYIMFGKNESPTYRSEQILLTELIEILTRGTPRDFDRWMLRAQDYPRKTIYPDSQLTGGSLSHASPMSGQLMHSYSRLMKFVEERDEREQGKSLDEVKREMERERVRQENQLQFDKQRMSQEFEVEKLRNAELMHMEYKRVLNEIERDVPRDLVRIQEQTQQFNHQRWMHIMNLMSMAMKTTVLVQAELRNNPLGEEIVEKLNTIYRELQGIDPTVALDEQKIVDIVQKILLKNRGFGGVA